MNLVHGTVMPVTLTMQLSLLPALPVLHPSQVLRQCLPLVLRVPVPVLVLLAQVLHLQQSLPISLSHGTATPVTITM